MLRCFVAAVLTLVLALPARADEPQAEPPRWSLGLDVGALVQFPPEVLAEIVRDRRPSPLPAMPAVVFAEGRLTDRIWLGLGVGGGRDSLSREGTEPLPGGVDRNEVEKHLSGRLSLRWAFISKGRVDASVLGGVRAGRQWGSSGGKKTDSGWGVGPFAGLAADFRLAWGLGLRLSLPLAHLTYGVFTDRDGSGNEVETKVSELVLEPAPTLELRFFF